MPLNADMTALIAQILPFAVMILVFYFLLIRPQKKREKETRQMLSALKVGDNITTIGGICGKIVKVQDEVLTIEVGADKVKLVIERWAVKNVEKTITD
jgi:preprotein translocase subunit YajC